MAQSKNHYFISVKWRFASAETWHWPPCNCATLSSLWAMENMQTDMHYFDSNALKWPINSNNCSSPRDNLCCLLLYIKTLKRCQSPINTSRCIKFPSDFVFRILDDQRSTRKPSLFHIQSITHRRAPVLCQFWQRVVSSWLWRLALKSEEQHSLHPARLFFHVSQFHYYWQAAS